MKINKTKFQGTHQITLTLLFKNNNNKCNFLVMDSMNSIRINDLNYNLNGIEELAWKYLINGSSKKKCNFKNMCVGTISQIGEVSLRTVINRKVDELQKKIFFYTDNRSRKFQELKAHDKLTLLFYDARQGVQISIKALATLDEDSTHTGKKWNESSVQARLNYMTIQAPNTLIELPGSGHNNFKQHSPTQIESEAFRKNFSVICCSVYELEFLYLNRDGNRKANFYYQNSRLQNSSWAVP